MARDRRNGKRTTERFGPLKLSEQVVTVVTLGISARRQVAIDQYVGRRMYTGKSAEGGAREIHPTTPNTPWLSPVQGVPDILEASFVSVHNHVTVIGKTVW